MKKTYLYPQTEMVPVEARVQILAGSSGEDTGIKLKNTNSGIGDQKIC